MSRQHTTARITALPAILVAAALVGGCQTGSQPEPLRFRSADNTSLEDWKERAETARPVTPAGGSGESFEYQEDAATTTIEQPHVLEVDESKPLPTQSTSLSMQDADVTVILRALAKAANVNILLGSGVSGNMSVNLQEVPWDQAFTGVVETRGLSYVWVGDIIRVMSLEEMNHDLEKERIEQQRKAVGVELQKVETLILKAIRLKYARASTLKPTLEELITRDWGMRDAEHDVRRGSVTVDEPNNTIILNAIASDIKKMVALVGALDRPTQQILIKAHIVETTQETAREIGIQWGGIFRADAGDWITGPASIVTQDLADAAVNQVTGFNPATTMAANFPAALGANGEGLDIGYVTESLGEHILTVRLSALEEDRKLNILASPAIATLDNQTALIESGREVPYQTLDDEGDINIEWKEALLKLEVTPHVIDGKLVRMEVETLKDELDFTRTVQGNPTVITKRAHTNLLLQDGQTTVIGGLTKENVGGSSAGVPFLRDVPGLGHLFGSRGKNSNMEELLIFITPHILTE